MKPYDKRDIEQINIPLYDDLSMKVVFHKLIEKYTGLKKRIPYYEDEAPNWLPQREFFWNVFNTLHHRVMAEMLDLAHERRFSGMGDMEGDQIEITSDILKAIQRSKYYACKVQTL